MRTLRCTAPAALMLVLCGCPSTMFGPGPTTAPAAKAKGPQAVVLVEHRAPGGPKDARPAVEPIIQIDLYHLSVPFDTISRNEAFWKTIDEDCIDVATRDLLLKNGLRVGRASNAQWENEIAKLLVEFPSTTNKTALVARQAKSMELLMKSSEGIEHVFVFNERNEAIGRTYERWENFMELSFQSAPRKPGHVRVALCPGVRSQRRRFVVNYRNEAQPEIQYVAPERLYDVNLRADLPPETFLIVAPSPDAQQSYSVGASFLVHDAPGERMESVLLIVPKPFVVNSDLAGNPLLAPRE